MNQPPDEFILVQEERLLAFVATCFEKSGIDAGHYARICLEAGCVGFSVQGYRDEGASRNIDPKLSAGFSGNPPISFAIPAGEEPAMVLDAGASVLASYSGEGSEELLERLPSAFFKSMGFIAVSTLLGGAMTGFTAPAADAIQERWPGAAHGGMVQAIDLEQVVDGDLFRAEADRYSRDLRANCAPIPGTDAAWLPGATEEQRMMARYRAEGIHFGEPEQSAARALHERFDVPLPWD